MGYFFMGYFFMGYFFIGSLLYTLLLIKRINALPFIHLSSYNIIYIFESKIQKCSK